jgi:hypothetical protein
MGSTTAIRPLTLQNSRGTYGTVPAPTTSGTTPRLSAPQFVSSNPTTRATQLPAPPPRLSAPTSAPALSASPSGIPANRGYGLDPAFAGQYPQGGPVPFQPRPATLNAPQAPLAPPPSTPPAGTTPPGTTAVSGSEVPYHVATGPSDATSSMLSKLATEAGRQLDQPTVWDDPLAKQIKDAQVAGINSNYDEAGKHLDASLADRGINYSTIAGGDIMDLQKQRAGALSSVDADIAAQRANSLAAGRASAFGNASSVFGSQQGADQQSRNNQVGERNYTDTLRSKAQSDAIGADDQYQQILNQAYGYGNSGAGNSALGQASGIYGSQAGQYGADQGVDQGNLAQLAELAAQFFGTGK